MISAAPERMSLPAIFILSVNDALGSEPIWFAVKWAPVDIAPSRYWFPVLGMNRFPCLITVLAVPLTTFEVKLSGFPLGSLRQSSSGLPTYKETTTINFSYKTIWASAACGGPSWYKLTFIMHCWVKSIHSLKKEPDMTNCTQN